MKLPGKQFGQFWAQEKSLTILLVILVVQIFIIIPLGEHTLFGKIVFLVFFIFLLITGIFLFVKSIAWRVVLIIILTLPALVGSDIFFHSQSWEISNNLAIALYCIFLGAIVLLRTFRKGQFTIHRIQGGVLVYLLISLVFALLYQSVYQIQGDASFKGLNLGDRKEFMYFSLVTLTTVGYGDITPAVVVARSLANFEALIGQLYPAILIAGIVTKVLESKTSGKNGEL
jgi:hypothetical protein